MQIGLAQDSEQDTVVEADNINLISTGPREEIQITARDGTVLTVSNGGIRGGLRLTFCPSRWELSQRRGDLVDIEFT